MKKLLVGALNTAIDKKRRKRFRKLFFDYMEKRALEPKYFLPRMEEVFRFLVGQGARISPSRVRVLTAIIGAKAEIDSYGLSLPHNGRDLTLRKSAEWYRSSRVRKEPKKEFDIQRAQILIARLYKKYFAHKSPAKAGKTKTSG